MVKNSKQHHLLVFLFVCVFVLSSCGSGPTPAPATMEPNAVFTAAAQTASARLTEIALSTPVPAEASPVPATAAPTQPAPSATAVLTRTAESSPTLAPSAVASTASPTSGAGGTPSGDKAEFVADVSIPDGSAIDPEAAFTKTWRVKNIGTTTWTTAYTLVHVGSDAIGAPASVALTKEVAPGDNVDISVDLTAPASAGKYTSYWRLKNTQGELFGVGVDNGALYVQISVSASEEDGEITSTPGASGGDKITDFSISIDSGSVTGKCPHTYTVSAVFTLNKAMAVTYQLEAASETPGYTFDLPPEQTSNFTAGTQTLVFSLRLTHTGSGYVVLHIIAPEDLTSNQANFNLTCQP